MTNAYNVIISKQAEQDFEEIYTYIAEVSPSNAALFVGELENVIYSLDIFPERCPIIPEVTPLMYDTYRHLIHQSYRIIFAIRDNSVVILRILHGARNVESDSI